MYNYLLVNTNTKFRHGIGIENLGNGSTAAKAAKAQTRHPFFD